MYLFMLSMPFEWVSLLIFYLEMSKGVGHPSSASAFSSSTSIMEHEAWQVFHLTLPNCFDRPMLVW